MLSTAGSPGSPQRHRPGTPRPVAVLLPGQGSQHVRMAAGLYRVDPVFTAAMDEVLDAMAAEGAPELRAEWLAERPTVSIDHVSRAQPLLYAVDYALGTLVLGWGVRPVALLGHSVGEVAAATLTGVFGLRDAVALVLDRVRRLATAPPGGMLAVAATPEQLRPFLTGDVVVGVVNAPRQTVLAGPTAPLAAVAESLRDSNFTCRRVPAESAFHSPALAEAAAGAEEFIASVAVAEPDTTVYSGYTAARLRREDAANPRFWARQPVEAVLFWPALDALLAAEGDVLLLEAGPGQGLATLARRHPAVRTGGSSVLALLPAQPGPPAADRRSVRAAALALRAEGHAVDLAEGL
ncbi:Malonyl CoA-acyl carrier protein transacylase [Actinokineospora spheciospongiae]|uniref:Malonyl CoA-acyl carrier protein transacylase n=1 Tax=Actinokineospora spheciospongiae TaxID=909613 RepID=W7J303_9PSEU|nr:acyltransferase domain-containing protein [Actinokineospora spheciospongiae]EWC63316.1 Malonyl CoA-acyl carrier protein transacylase [Actinokineospora spheciospongiae]